ncbi:hypothetical protein ACIBEJ_48760 [Nonomuraea sp. NPDC050790]|uniref:hypothetical protein n=1 Tax=Nonomuraea sp. NPDC050790 TaxID=3364371 RepID=UPI00378D2E9F
MKASYTYDHLSSLRGYLPELDRALIPSATRRRWNQRDMSPEQRASLDAQAVAEREAKERNLTLGLKALGNAPAPINLHALDVRDSIAIGIAELEGAVCDVLGLTPNSRSTTVERIRRLIDLLDRIAHHDDLAQHVHNETARLRQAARVAVGDQEPVVRLSARCVICNSVSLRAFPERGTIACANPTCRCDAEGCPCSWDEPKRHIWPFEQWPWLADVLAEGIGVTA